MVHNTQVTLYQTLRSEILQRLSFQQQIINFSLVLLGIFPLVLSQLECHVEAFLIGAFVSLLLAFASLRQYVSINQIAEYIEKINEDFGSWEKWCRKDILFKQPLNIILVFCMGIAGVLFSLVVSVIYLIPAFICFFASNCEKSVLLFLFSELIIGGIIFVMYQSCIIRRIVVKGA
jgi:hypothetical protein